MFKLKFKILLLLLIFAFAGKDAWGTGSGNNWWCYQIEVDVKLVTGEGLVYDPEPGEKPGTIEVGEVDKNNAYAKSTTHVLDENKYFFQQHTPNLDHNGLGDEWVMKSAVPNTQNPNVSYIFKGWMYAGNAGDGSVVKHVSGNQNEFTVGEYLTEADYLNNIGGYAIYAKTQNKCSYTGEHGVSTADGADHKKSHDENPPKYSNDAIIYALFEKQDLTPAVTIQYDIDKCEVEYPVDYQTNAIGNTITIAARRKADTRDKGWEKEFVGWADEDGNIVSTDNPWTLKIEKKAVYRAVIEDKYRFFRIKNYGEPHRYVSAISDEASSDNFMDLMDNIELLRLNDNKNEIICDPGSIVQIDVLKNPYQSSAEYVDITVQDSKASKFYKFEAGVTIISLPYDYETKTWNFKAPLALFRDESGVPKMQAISDNYSKWIIEHLDLDLETKENYFSLDPEKLVQVGDKYYTTLRTSWNILFNPEQMTPYVVTSVDETEGTFEMEPITGNIIPAGTPVIIETKSSDIEENRMVPTKTAAANGAVPAGNLLKYSEKYFPNQPAPVSNCKQLMVKDGLLTFGGNALSSVNGNEAYISVSNDVSRIQKVTLAELVAKGEPGWNYVITDLIGIAEVNDKDNHDHMIICKDSNGYAAKDVKTDDGWIDYIHEVSELDVPDVYDQSNWIALHLPTEDQISTDILNGAPLKGVKGRLISKENPEFMLDAVPTCDGDKVAFTANTYIAASFYGDNHQPGYGGKKQFFFVQPKPMEYATVTWSQWYGGKFVVPSSDDHPEWNQAGLKGQFDYKGDYLEQDPVDLQSGHTYEMKAAVIKYKTATGGTQARAPRRAEGASKEYVVYPLTITRITDEQNGVITGVQQLSGDRQVMHVDYYNVSGMRSERPWQGVNIVVTRYSDGTTSAVKMLR